jgi:ribosomal-protein-alanine N-acetyltransferase
VRRGRLRAQPRGVRGDAELRAGARQGPPQRLAPLTLLETERLLLRRFREADRDTVARWNAHPDFTRHLAGPQTREASDAAFDRWQQHWKDHGFGLLGVVDRESGALIGRAGPSFHRAWPEDPEIGWALDPAWWGRGLATEGGAACVRWAFDGLGFGRVVSITTEENLASRRVMAKLGFELHAQVPFERWQLWVHALDSVRPRPHTSGT